MKKRVLSAILCSIMAASLLAGCGGGGESSAPAADGGSAGTDSTATEEVKRTEDGYQIFDDVRLTYLYCWNGGFQPLENQYDNDVSKAIRDKIGVTVEMEGVMMTESEKLNLMFASGDMPDIVNAPFWGGADACTVTIRKAAMEGRLIDISDKLSDYPNVARAFEEQVATKQYLESELDRKEFNGARYILPWGAQNEAENIYNYAYGIFVRSDVPEALGIDPLSIKTQDQLWDFMKKAQEYGFKDVNGNDSIVASTCLNGHDYGQYTVGFSPKKVTGYSLDENNKIVSDTFTDRWMESQLYLWRMVQEGLMDVECFKQSAERANEKIGNGTPLFVTSQYSMIIEPTKQSGLYDSHPEMRYIPVGPLNYQTGEPLTAMSVNSRGGSPVLIFPTTCKNIDAALTWLDYLNTVEGATLATYGFEGDTYELNEAGQPRMTEEWTKRYQEDAVAVTEELRQRGINYWFSKNDIVDKRFTWWGEFSPFEATAEPAELADYKQNLRPVELVEGYPLNALESGFERYQDWLELQTELTEGEYSQQAYFAETEEEARAILEEYREQLRTGRDGVYQEFMDYLTEQYNSRDDIIL